MNHKLMDEITKILILSRYEESHGRGDTAQEMQSFETCAIDTYLGKSDDPNKVIVNIFYAKVNRDVALIFSEIERHPNQAMHSDAQKQCPSCVDADLVNVPTCPKCGYFERL